LLVQYLYKFRKMSLPGLGIFTLDKSVVLPEENDKALLSMPNAVQFQNANIPSADKELIAFICENTGKIKPLAISDLESYLNLGTEMLNIGKPFHLEGIGTITKNKNGRFDFTPGEYTLIRENADTPADNRKRVYAKDKRQETAQPIVQNRNLLKILALAGALGVIAWGGWVMYKKASLSTQDKLINSTPAEQQIVPVSPDSLGEHATRKDSARMPVNDTAHPGTINNQQMTDYKFVILTTGNKPHALRRYNQLASFDLKIHLYQKDSTFFKVYFQFPALAKDTMHIKDSLRREYAHIVTIEP